MYFSRGGINTMNDSKAEKQREREREGEKTGGGGGGGRNGTFVWENLMGYFGEERECYLTAVNKTAIPLSGDVTVAPNSTASFPVCAFYKKWQRISSEVAQTRHQSGGILIRLSSVSASIWNVIFSLISSTLSLLRTSVENRSWKWNSLRTPH